MTLRTSSGPACDTGRAFSFLPIRPPARERGRRPRRALRARLAAALLWAAAGSASAQPPVERQKPEPIRARVELVNVDVTVTDARGSFVRGLQREDFRLFDDGVEQPITHFAPVEAPGAVLVLVETSPAVFLIHRQHLDAAYALAEGLAGDDEVALASYDRAARLLLPFSPDKRAFGATVSRLRYNLGVGDLRLYDAIDAALGWLAPRPGKKALVMLSTGLDVAGAGGFAALEERLRTSEVALYPIALGGELRDYRGEAPARRRDAPPSTPQLSFEAADDVLNRMAAITGGRAFFPRRATEFLPIYQQIAAALRHRYSLGFLPPVRDARFHPIEVRVPGLGRREAEAARRPAGYRVTARQGYLAPGS